MRINEALNGISGHSSIDHSELFGLIYDSVRKYRRKILTDTELLTNLAVCKLRLTHSFSPNRDERCLLP